jgi:hypothetical protein
VTSCIKLWLSLRNIRLKSLENFKIDTSGLSKGKYDEELTSITDLFRFLSERAKNPRKYQARLKAFLSHPLIKKDQTSDASMALTHPLKYLFPATARRLAKQLKEVSSKKVENRFNVDPWNFQTEIAYWKALDNDIVSRAESGMLKPKEFPTMGTPVMNLVTGVLPKTVILGLDVNKMNPEKFLHSTEIKNLKRQYPGFQFYLSENSFQHLVKRRRNGENKIIDYRALVLYVPMLWFQAYPLWYEFGRSELEHFE